MSLDDILKKLESDDAVKGAFHLDGELYKKVIAEESSVTTSSMGMPLVNRALEATLKRDTAVCVFCTDGFEIPIEHTMILEDGDGNRIGHDVPVCMIDDFKDDTEIFWLCDDFAVYPNRQTSDETLMVMLPLTARSIGEQDGAKDPIILYPATTTDIILKEHFGIPLDSHLASAIVSFNLIK